MNPKQRRILMICAHEPSLDPRIGWEAESAARHSEVTVLGFNRDDDSLPQAEAVADYRVVRLDRESVSGLLFFWQLKEIIPTAVWFPLAMVVVLLAPLLAAGELLGRAVRGTIRSAGHSPALSRLLNAMRVPALLDRGRNWLLGRVEHILAVLRLQFAPAAAAFWNYVRAMPERPDVVHCNDLDTLLVGVLAKRHYGCRLVYDAHEFYPVSDPHGKWVDITFFSLIERLMIRQADAVVTVNPQLGEAMRAAYRLERVHSVPNAEPWLDGRPPPDPECEMERLARGRVKFLFQGRFTPGRGIDELIEGWAGVDGRRAALFLRGPDNRWREKAIELAAGLGLYDRSVYFLDAVTEDELVTAAAEADVGVIPYKPTIINDRLACPNKLSQYLHAGLMVLANDLTYVRSVLTEAEAGVFYNSADLRTLVDAVHSLLDDPALLQQGRTNALRFARERFNWQVQSEILDELYRGEEPQRANVRVLASGAARPSFEAAP